LGQDQQWQETARHGNSVPASRRARTGHQSPSAEHEKNKARHRRPKAAARVLLGSIVDSG
jgi:hypothetical protein